MATEGKKIHILLDSATYEALSSIVKSKKKRGQKVSITGVAKEMLQQATGNIEGERPVKYRDLEENIKQYNRGLDRVIKLWFKSSKLTLMILLTFLDNLGKDLGEEELKKMLDDNRKQAAAALKEKENEDEED